MAQGIAISRDEARERLDSLIEGAQTEGATNPIRVGEATLVRYLAARSAFQGRLGADSPALRSESASLDRRVGLAGIFVNGTTRYDAAITFARHSAAAARPLPRPLALSVAAR